MHHIRVLVLRQIIATNINWVVLSEKYQVLYNSFLDSIIFFKLSLRIL